MPPAVGMTPEKIGRSETFSRWNGSIPAVLFLDRDLDLVVDDADLILLDRDDDREVGRLAGADVERASMQRALDLAVDDRAVGERRFLVRANVVDSVVLTVEVDQADRLVVDLD